MFTESDRIGCSFLACRCGSAKYPGLGSAHLDTVLPLISMATVTLPVLYCYHIVCKNFPACRG